MATDRQKARQGRGRRVRYKIKQIGQGRLRLSVYRSSKNIYAQIINDAEGRTLVSASTLEKEIKDVVASGGNMQAATMVGKLLAQKALKNGIESVVFDRGGFLYHGRVKVLAEAAREGGLKF